MNTHYILCALKYATPTRSFWWKRNKVRDKKLAHTQSHIEKRPILDSCEVFLIPTPKCFLSCHAVSHLNREGLGGVLTAAKGRAAGWRRPHRETMEALWQQLQGAGGREQMCSVSASSVQFSRSVMSDSLQPMDCSMPSFPVLHQLPELAQTHIHQVGDAIQPLILCRPLLFLPPISFPASGSFPTSPFFHQVAKVLELQLQHQSFQ